MTFLWAHLLWLLLSVPVLVGTYIVLLRRRRLVVRYSSLSLVREALRPRSAFRRHVPPLLFLIGLSTLILALARPAADLTLLTRQQTIILAMDVSLSRERTRI